MVGPISGPSSTPCSAQNGCVLFLLDPKFLQRQDSSTHIDSKMFKEWLVGGFKHFLFSISYMGCHPSHWRTPSFFKMVITIKELDDGKIYRKTLYVMVKTMVSCRFSREIQSIETNQMAMHRHVSPCCAMRTASPECRVPRCVRRCRCIWPMSLGTIAKGWGLGRRHFCAFSFTLWLCQNSYWK